MDGPERACARPKSRQQPSFPEEDLELVAPESNRFPGGPLSRPEVGPGKFNADFAWGCGGLRSSANFAETPLSPLNPRPRILTEVIMW